MRSAVKSLSKRLSSGPKRRNDQIYVNDAFEIVTLSTLSLSGNLRLRRTLSDSDGSDAPSQASYTLDERLDLLLQELQQNPSLTKRIERLIQIEKLIKKLRGRLDTRALAKPFKQHISGDSGLNWKRVVLGADYCLISATYAMEFDVNLDITKPIEEDEQRFKTIITKEYADNAATTVGTSYAKINGTLSKVKNLDASLLAYTKNGFILTIADGYGGHVDEVEDKAIAKASRTATKHAARLLAHCNSAAMLQAQLLDIVAEIKREVLVKAKGSTCTLLAVRAYSEENALRIVGFSIGDCLLCAWDPEQKTIQNLCVAKSNRWGAAEIAQSMAKDVQHIDKSVPANNILLGMTDGAYDMLPTLPVDRDVDELDVTLNESAINDCMKKVPNDSVSGYLQHFMMESRKNLGNIRKKLEEDSQMVGDDVTLCGVCVFQK